MNRSLSQNLKRSNSQERYEECCYISSSKKGFRLLWEVTHFCPNSCEYCITWSSPQREVFESDIDLTMKNIETLVNAGDINEVLISGGEPLVVLKKISPLISFLEKKGIEYSFSSSLYDVKLFLKLLDYKPHTIYLAIDPPNKKEESIFKAEYEKIDEKLRMLKDTGIPVKLVSVVNRNNYKGLPVLMSQYSSLISKHENVSRIAFCREYQIGRAAVSEPLTSRELSGTFKSIREWSKTIPVQVTFINFDAFHSPLNRCPAGINIMALLPNADIAPCPLLYRLSRNHRVGNLNTDSVGDILARLEDYRASSDQYRELTRRNTKECHACEISGECGGGCPASLPIASNHISKRVCERTPKRVPDHERELLAGFHNRMRDVYSPKIRPFAAPKSALPKEIEKNIRDYVIKNLRSADTAHSIEHIDCVVSLAKHISKKEGASEKITVTAAYLHDISPKEPSMRHMHTFNSAVQVEEFLHKNEYFSEDEIFHIKNCIYTSSYGAYLLGYDPLSLEAQVVRDADWLDAIGARGIARAFSYGNSNGAGEIGYPESDPEEFMVSVDMNITGTGKTPIQHFYTKLLKIYRLLQTASAKEIGLKRHRIMVEFLNNFRIEVDINKSQADQLHR